MPSQASNPYAELKSYNSSGKWIDASLARHTLWPEWVSQNADYLASLIPRDAGAGGLRVMTMNVYGEQDYAQAKRTSSELLELYQDARADIVMVQEGKEHRADSLARRFRNEYERGMVQSEWIGHGVKIIRRPRSVACWIEEERLSNEIFVFPPNDDRMQATLRKSWAIKLSLDCRCAVFALIEVDRNGQARNLLIANSHLSLNKSTRVRQAAEIREKIAEIVEDYPVAAVVLGGDFNAWTDSAELNQLTDYGEYLRDAFRDNQPPMTCSYGTTVDHMYYRNFSKEISLKGSYVAPSLLSDHLPLILDLDLFLHKAKSSEAESAIERQIQQQAVKPAAQMAKETILIEYRCKETVNVYPIITLVILVTVVAGIWLLSLKGKPVKEEETVE